MTQITQTEIDEVLEYFCGIDTDNCRCKLCAQNVKELKYPILIGGVLKKMKDDRRRWQLQSNREYIESAAEFTVSTCEAIYLKWSENNASLSLQEIVEGGWEEEIGEVICTKYKTICNETQCQEGENCDETTIKYLKQPQANLISFLHKLIK